MAYDTKSNPAAAASADPEAERLLKGFEKAKEKRKHWEPRIEEMYQYAMPGRSGFHEQTPGQSRTDLIFDETAVVGVPEFASRLHQGVMPDEQRWLRPEPGELIPEEDRFAVQAQLDEVNNLVFAELHNSNLSQEVHESFQDLAVGTCNLLMEDGGAESTFLFQSHAQPSVWICSGPFGLVDRIYRLRRVEARHLKTVYGRKVKLTPEIEQLIQNKPEEELKVVEALYRDYTAKNAETWELRAILEDQKHILHERRYAGQGACPWIIGRWSRIAGEDYGRGPLYNALPAIKTCNLTVQMILENAQMAIAGVFTGEDDGVLNPETTEIMPGVIIPHAPGSEGLRAVQSHARFDVGELILNDQRLNIKKALYNETLGPREGTPPSATEVAERMADLFRQIGSPLRRVLSEVALPIYLRALFILKQRGMIELPRIDGRNIKIRFTSPLARAQQNEDFASAARFLAVVNQSFGPQATMTVVKQRETMVHLADLSGFPSKLIASTAEMKQQAADMGKLAAGAMEAGATPGEVIQAASRFGKAG